MEKTKVCGDCGKEKPLSEYTRYAYRNRYVSSGEVKTYWGFRCTTYCKPCMGARSVAWRKANPERFRAYQRAYYQAKRAKQSDARD